MLAGNVTVKISGGDLIIRGDNQSNAITVEAGDSAGEVVISGLTGNTGSATSITAAPMARSHSMA
jgi:hypothetical protein